MDQPDVNQKKQNPSNESQPFEIPESINPPEKMGGAAQPNQPNEGNQPPAYPKKSIVPYILIVVLIVILLLGTLAFADWKGWVKIGLIPKSSPTPETSPQLSPQITSTPEVSTNVNDTTRKSDLVKIKQALLKYYKDTSKYPIAETRVKTSDANSSLAKALVPNYLSSLPDDPLAPNYYYAYKSDGKTFELTCVLEDKSDTSGSMVGSNNIFTVTEFSYEVTNQ